MRGILTFNTGLVHADAECIEYVVVHEFCHFLHPDHSPAFHADMTRLMPDWKQRKKRLNETSLERIGEDEEGYVTDIPDERFRPDAVHDQTELRDALARAIGELPGPQREIVILRDIQGLSYEEIAGALALESGTVKSRLSRARENLRKKLLRNGNISAPQGSNRLKGGKADEILR